MMKREKNSKEFLRFPEEKKLLADLQKTLITV
jgi:hypothetical protein